MKRLITGVFFAATLGGCGGGPSKGDIESAFLEKLQAVDPNAKIESLEVGECKKLNDAPGYACGISAKTSLSVMGVPIATEAAHTAVMVKIGDEWKMMDR